MSPSFSGTPLRALLGATLFAVAACSDAAPPATSPPIADITTPQNPLAARAPLKNAPITANAIARVASARARTSWVAAMHTDAMNEVRAMRDDWRATRPHHKQQRCEAVLRIARRYTERATAHVGMPAGVMNGVARKAAVDHGCAPGADLAMTLPAYSRGAALLSLFSTTALTEEVTGEYQNYLGGLDNAYASAGSPDEVSNLSWAVVNQAAANGVGQADLDVLAAIAGVGVSSGYEWYSFQQGGGFDDPGQDEMSMFARKKLVNWKTVGWADLGGAIVGAIGGAAAGPPGMFAGAVTRGAIASGIAALAQY